MVVVGVTKGSMVAGGSDWYGYVSQAHLWATGSLRIETPPQGALPEGVPSEAVAPLGYRLAPDRRWIVPVYAPGFPMLMAVFELVGGPGAVFYAMPLLAAVTVLATYLLGVMLGGRAAGVLAALLLATSPPFLFQLSHAPMSDIAASAWWTIALLLLPRPSRMSALMMGAAAGLAILTRPNLVPLAIVPGGALVWNVIADRSSRGPAIARLALFAIGPIASAVTVGYSERLLVWNADGVGVRRACGRALSLGFPVAEPDELFAVAGGDAESRDRAGCSRPVHGAPRRWKQVEQVVLMHRAVSWSWPACASSP